MIPPALEGRYQLRARIAAGGMADVWRATDVLLDVDVAVKLPRGAIAGGDDERASVLHEQRAASRLRHPGIVALLAAGEHAGRPYLVFELVDGPSLRDRLTAAGALPAGEVVRAGLELCDALAYAHSQGVIHNDVKPENILFDHGRARLTDFGVAALVAQTVGSERADSLLGTIAYMAPEVIQGEPASPQSDIYALGLVLFEAATGRHAFPASSAIASAGQRLLPGPPALPWRPGEASPALQAAIARALHPEPALRFASASELAAALQVTPYPTVRLPRPNGGVILGANRPARKFVPAASPGVGGVRPGAVPGPACPVSFAAPIPPMALAAAAWPRRREPRLRVAATSAPRLAPSPPVAVFPVRRRSRPPVVKLFAAVVLAIGAGFGTVSAVILPDGETVFDRLLETTPAPSESGEAAGPESTPAPANAAKKPSPTPTSAPNEDAPGEGSTASGDGASGQSRNAESGDEDDADNGGGWRDSFERFFRSPQVPGRKEAENSVRDEVRSWLDRAAEAAGIEGGDEDE